MLYIMKRVLNILFYALGCGSLGLGIGAQIAGTDSRWLVMIPYITAGVFLFFAIMISSLILAHKNRQKNETVNLKKQDLILQVGQDYTVGKRDYVHSGQYQVLLTNENDKTVKIRVNDFVKDYQHNTTLILANGDTISARSANVILRQ